MPLTQNEDLKTILSETKTIAVVGWSNKANRPSNEVAAYLTSAGYSVYHVNPVIASTPEQPVYATLAEVPVPIDVVDVFRRSEDVPDVVEAAIRVGANVVWMQEGITNDAAAQRAEDAGLKVVQDRCMKITHRKLMGS
ncbi:MAG TPA: CoA-binding protein [Aggregatilineales bacterium]|nr:CoA-binding protein [Anaerolineales bacterium]HRE48539.1 CoA-binding protein [Aggregatilineales bacterium]